MLGRMTDAELVGCRGSGKTTDQLKTLQPGDYFVVHTEAMVVHARYLLKKHCSDIRPTDIRIITMQNIELALLYRRFMEVDHFTRTVLGERLKDMVNDNNDNWEIAHARDT